MDLSGFSVLWPDYEDVIDGVKPGSPTDAQHYRNLLSKFNKLWISPNGLYASDIPRGTSVKPSAKKDKAKSEASVVTRVTASKATEHHLKDYGWTFHKRDVGDTSLRSVTNKINNSFEKWQGTPIFWPVLDQGDFLQRDIHQRFSFYQELFPTEIAPSGEIPGLDDPVKPGLGMGSSSGPIVDFSYIKDMNYMEHSHHIRSFLEVLLPFPVGKAPSELAVQQYIADMLNGFFRGIKDSGFESDNNLKQPTIIGCFGSQPKPDLLSRMKHTHGEGSEWMEFFDPVIAIGEAKIKVKNDNPVVQMACALQPTLHTFMGWLGQKWRDEHPSDPPSGEISEENPIPIKWTEIKIPSWMWVCGIVYDEDGVSFHGYRPVIRDGKYAFACWEIGGLRNIFPSEEIPGHEYHPYTKDHLDLLKALIWMWKHTSELAEEIPKAKSFKLPGEFERLGRAWSEGLPEKWTKMREDRYQEYEAKRGGKTIEEEDEKHASVVEEKKVKEHGAS